MKSTITKNSLTKTIFIGIILGLYCSYTFGQLTHSWNPNKNKDIKLAPGDYIKVIGITKNEKFELRQKDHSIDTVLRANDKILFDEKFLELFSSEFKMVSYSSSKELSVTKTTRKGSDPKPIEVKNSQFLPEIDENHSLIIDAIYLKANIQDNCKNDKILKKYFLKDNKIELNQFLSEIGFELECEKVHSSGKEGEQGILSNLGGLDVTNFADGLAKFLVKRVKEELTINFFVKFYEEIEKQEELIDLFPATAQGLLSLGNDVYNFQRYISMLREQFEADLKILPQNLETFIRNDSLELFVNRLDEKLILQSGLKITQGFMDDDHPGEIIKSLIAFYNGNLETIENDKSLDQTTYFNIYNGLNTLSVVSESLRETRPNQENRYWVDKETINEVLNDPLTFQIYVGLLAERFEKRNILFYPGSSLEEYNSLYVHLNNASEKVSLLLSDFQPFMEEISTINALINSDKKNEEKFSFVELSRYFSAINGLLESTSSILKTLNHNSHLDSVLIISKSITSLYANVVNQRYHAGVLDLIQLYKIHLIKRANKNTPQKDKLEGQLRFIETYTPFMASLLLAQNSDEVAAAIEAFALPSGSARIKRVSRFNVSLNAYVGPFAAFDFPDFQIEKGEFVAGLSAPVGVALSLGKTRIFRE